MLFFRQSKRIFFYLAFTFAGVFAAITLTYANRQYAHQANGWYMYFGTHKFSERWSLHAEVQWRANQVITKPQQLLLRTGINYHLSNWGMFSAGYCFVETWPYGKQPVKAAFPEHRVWQQFQTKSASGRWEFVNRLRMEQRFVQIPTLRDSVYVPGKPIYSNRGRILNRITISLSKKTLTDKSVYVSAYNEIFINFGKNVALNIFDQNRAYVALGYVIPKIGRMEAGYMNQLIFKPDGVRVESNHTLQLAFFCTVSFPRKTKDPSGGNSK